MVKAEPLRIESTQEPSLHYRCRSIEHGKGFWPRSVDINLPGGELAGSSNQGTNSNQVKILGFGLFIQGQFRFTTVSEESGQDNRNRWSRNRQVCRYIEAPGGTQSSIVWRNIRRDSSHQVVCLDERLSHLEDSCGGKQLTFWSNAGHSRRTDSSCVYRSERKKNIVDIRGELTSRSKFISSSYEDLESSQPGR